MKIIYSILAICAAAITGTPTVASGQVRLDELLPQQLRVTDPKLLNPCDIGEALDDLLMPLGIALGFENQNDCRSGQRAWNYRGSGRKSDDLRVSLAGFTVRQALDEVTRSLGFSWKQVGDVIVVRPPAAWTSPTNVLNVHLGRVEISGRLYQRILPELLNATTPSLFVPSTRVAPIPKALGRESAFNFQGGTLLDALNAIATQYGHLTWQVDHGAGDNSSLAFHSLTDLGASLVVPIRLRAGK